MALQPLYKGLGKAEFEGGEVKKMPHPRPSPNGEGSDYRLCYCDRW